MAERKNWLEVIDRTFDRLDYAVHVYKSYRNPNNTSFLSDKQTEKTGRVLETRLSGVSYGNRQQIIARLKPDDHIYLQRDYHNPHDANAIGVYLASSRQHIGWLPRELAANLAADMDKGAKPEAKIKSISAAKQGRFRGVIINITVPGMVTIEEIEVRSQSNRTPPHGIPRQQEKGKARKPDNPWMKPMQTIKLVIRMRIEFPVGMWKILKKTTLIIFKPEPLLI